jgi:hypothetical protein
MEKQKQKRGNKKMTKKTSVKKFVVGELVVPIQPVAKITTTGDPSWSALPSEVYKITRISSAGIHTVYANREYIGVVFLPQEIERYAETQPVAEVQPKKTAATLAPESADRKDLVRAAVNKSKAEIFGFVGCIVAMIGSMILAVALVNSVPEESRPFIIVGVPLVVLLGLFFVFMYQALKLGIVGSDD